MERIVYILGAGFSAPLGIPVMSQFRLRSQDLYFGDPEKYSHFKAVLETINELSVVKNYFESDLYNIEEILSILEMRSQLTGDDSLRNSVERYICDTVMASTPSLEATDSGFDQLFPAWTGEILATDHLHSIYFEFLAAARGMDLWRGPNSLQGQLVAQGETGYRVDFVTLNYDLVLERSAAYLSGMFSVSSVADFQKSGTPSAPASTAPHLVKLHGCAEAGSIVPPTWSKTLNEKIVATWATGHDLLEAANHIRFVGYSLPESDAYVRYFLKSAITGNRNLKTIRAYCLDDDGSVEQRYRDFIRFNFFRFFNTSTTEHLRSVVRRETPTNRSGRRAPRRYTMRLDF